jgi:hypothetical protein
LPADVTAVASPCALGRLFDRMVMIMTVNVNVNVNVKSEVPFLKACLLVGTDSPRKVKSASTSPSSPGLG